MDGQSADRRPLLNLTELAYFLDVSLPTVRRLMLAPGFPIAKRGSHGVAYGFDPVAVIEWKKANEAELEAGREARAWEVAQLKLDLVGGMSVDPAGVRLSAREQLAFLEAEYRATQIAKLRRELVLASDVEAQLRNTFTVLRNEVVDTVARLSDQFQMSQDMEAGLKAAVEAALRRAADLLSGVTACSSEGRQSLLPTGSE